jgi:nitroimidazol reductase NimA-like FMN-containing flavoprotein (pyridoxamine 5'-phosphate oxidase superfamily)
VTELVHPRRRDREREEAWIRAYLERAPWGVLALASEVGPPHLNSNLFLFRAAPDRIYLHSARTGGLPEGLAGEEGVPASFTAAGMGRLLPADTALEFSVEYHGVVAMGLARTVEDPEEARESLDGLLAKYAPHLTPGTDYRPIVPEELRRTAVFRLDIEGWSGKEKTVGDHPGAVPIPALPVPFPHGHEPGTGPPPDFDGTGRGG